MQSVVYDVAVSADGFISGPDHDVSHFPSEGEMVEDYFERLSTYQCAIMGRETYEFGYRFGLEPGANPYPHMMTYVFSQTINLPQKSDVTVVQTDAASCIDMLRKTVTSPIYLCGGGHFAGWLLRKKLINRLRLKRAPIFLGTGTSIFGGQACTQSIECTGQKDYGDGNIYQEFDLL